MGVVEGVCDGDWDSAHVLIDGARLEPERSLKVWNHSPSGFAWGYAGSGPAQLALAILLELNVPEEEAVRLHQSFKFKFIATLPQNGGWEIDTDDIDRWVAEQGVSI